MGSENPPPHPAHVLWVELTTRIATRHLHFRSGDEETAVTSIHSLFAKTRELMEKHQDQKQFVEVAEKMLNDAIRPYTARWHGWMTPDPKLKNKDGSPASKFRDPQVRRVVRRELRQLQPLLCGYAKAFDLLREGKGGEKDDKGKTVEDWISGRTEILEALKQELGDEEPAVEMGKKVSVALLPQIGLDWPFPGAVDGKTILDAELAFIRDRRNLVGNAEVKNGIGLALSGGGIKSATFCLGVVQELVHRGMFRQVDYLSTVSGGGYLGTFISAYLGSLEQPTGTSKDPKESRPKEAFEPEENGKESRAVRHLRNHSKYLLHGGLWGKLNIAGLLASGVVANLLMILPIPLLISLVIVLMAREGFWNDPVDKWSPAGIVFAVLSGTLAVCWFLMPMIQSRTEKSPAGKKGAGFRGFWQILTLIMAVLAALAGALLALPKLQLGYVVLRDRLHEWLQGLHLSENFFAGLAAAVPVVLGAVGFLVKNQRLQKAVMGLFVLSGPLFHLFVILFVTAKLGMGDNGGEWSWGWVAALALLLLVWSVFGVNINALAPHRYYRARLCECYLLKACEPELGWWDELVARFWRGYVPTRTGEGGLGAVKHLKLSSIGESKAAPYHLINAFVNLPASKNRNLRGRKGDFFMFSRDVCGSPATGYVKTTELENADPRLDLGTAMAISGAAANTNMGWRSLVNFRFLMTLLNVRLGYWIPNFRLRKNRSDGKPEELKGANVGSLYLLAEMGGRIQENMRFLNLSDGGHIENLGAYELLRRKCKFIISVDGGGNRDITGGDLQRLERYAAIDFGITMEYDLAELQADEDGIAKAQAILVKIHYGRDEIGWMIYLRPGITGVEPTYLLDHWRTNPLFPYESIADQIFEEEQFEGYRCLGQRAAGSLFREEFKTDRKDIPVDELFARLARNLLPDNDPAFASSRCERTAAVTQEQGAMKAAEAAPAGAPPPAEGEGT